VGSKLTRSLLLTATIFVAGGEVALAESTGVPKNLIVITLDTTRADFLTSSAPTRIPPRSEETVFSPTLREWMPSPAMEPDSIWPSAHPH
jgi:hypothetical protein